MIQRIQTIYVLIATILIGFLLYLPIAEIASDGKILTFSAKGIMDGIEVVFSGLPILIFIALIVLLHMVVIFSFKKRIRQIRVLVFTMILMIGLTGLFFYFTYGSFSEETVAFKIPVVFPLVAIILDYLAIRAIGKDEALIRSLDRIR